MIILAFFPCSAHDCIAESPTVELEAYFDEDDNVVAAPGQVHPAIPARAEGWHVREATGKCTPLCPIHKHMGCGFCIAEETARDDAEAAAWAAVWSRIN